MTPDYYEDGYEDGYRSLGWNAPEHDAPRRAYSEGFSQGKHDRDFERDDGR